MANADTHCSEIKNSVQKFRSSYHQINLTKPHPTQIFQRTNFKMNTFWTYFSILEQCRRCKAIRQIANANQKVGITSFQSSIDPLYVEDSLWMWVNKLMVNCGVWRWKSCRFDLQKLNIYQVQMWHQYSLWLSELLDM